MSGNEEMVWIVGYPMATAEPHTEGLCEACFAPLDDAKRCTACQADNSRRPLRYRFFSAKCFMSCPDCKNQVPVNGAVRRVQCDQCQCEVDLVKQWEQQAEYWQRFSIRMREPVAAKMPFMSGSMETAAPVCGKCGQTLAAATISLKLDRPYCCSGCGEPVSVFRPPPWLKGVFPKVEQFFCAERDDIDLGGQQAVRAVDAFEPVFFSCPGCGGNLTITAELERTVKCEYCQASAYLPDPLWLRFHPVRTANTWYIRLRTAGPKKGAGGKKTEKNAETESISDLDDLLQD